MIKVVLSLVFADKVVLGWDPTVAAKYDGEQRLFDIEVNGNHHKTSSTNILSETKADEIYSSATRIFKVFTGDDKEEKKPVVIKDYWPSDENETEDVVRRKILEDISDADERCLFEKLTLTPIGFRRVKVGNQEDHTERTILRCKGPTDMFKIRASDSEAGSKSSSSLESEEYKEEVNEQTQELYRGLVRNQRRTYFHRWHFKLRNLDDMLSVLVSAMKGKCSRN